MAATVSIQGRKATGLMDVEFRCAILPPHSGAGSSYASCLQTLQMISDGPLVWAPGFFETDLKYGTLV